jgi:NitT/TauT family transport system substrate-binding protein
MPSKDGSASKAGNRWERCCHLVSWTYRQSVKATSSARRRACPEELDVVSIGKGWNTMRTYLACAVVCGLSAGVLPAHAQMQPVRVGIASVISDVSIFIAEKKGYFADEGLTITITPFTSGANMVAPLGAGQLDAGGGSASAGFYNAVARGIKMRIVADKASSLPGYPVNRLVVLKSHVDNGRFKTLADLKGMKIGMNAPGVSAQVGLDAALQRGGLTRTDINTTDMPMPDYVPALLNKAIDGAMATEPHGTLSVRNGSAVAVIGDDELIPGHQIANLLYSDDFATKRPDDARKFMKAYLRALRFYNGALKDGRLAGANANEVIGILLQTSPIKDAAILGIIIPNGSDPNGFINVPSLKLDFDNYRAAELIKGNVTVEQVIDRSFVDWAVKQLGPAGN